MTNSTVTPTSEREVEPTRHASVIYVNHFIGIPLVTAPAWFLAPHVGRRGRVLLGTYVVGMAVTLVFTAEHYVIDVLVGWLVAVVAIAVSRTLRPSSTTAPVPSPAPNALVLRIPSSGGSR